jgi:hypothetical protein
MIIWRPSHPLEQEAICTSFYGIQDSTLVAQVAFYEAGPHWCAYIRQHKLNGRYSSSEEARQAVSDELYPSARHYRHRDT